MNIQAMLGTRPATGSSRRPGVIQKSKERVPPGSASERHDTVKLSMEGKERAAADSQGEP